MKKSFLFILVLLVTLFVAVTPALAQDEDLVPLTIFNDTDSTVWISMTNSSNFQYVSVGAGTTRKFTIERGTYDTTTGACGIVAEGTFDLSSQVRLRFVPCSGTLDNHGEPTQEKVNLNVPPPTDKWRFQFK